MSINKLTTPLQTALGEAQSLALGRDHGFIEPIHLLKALLDQSPSVARSILAKANVRIERLQQELEAKLAQIPNVQSASPGEIYPSNDLQRLFNHADKLSQQYKDRYLSS